MLNLNLLTNLREIPYYQDNHSVENYLDKFQALISKARYIDFYTIIVKFK